MSNTRYRRGKLYAADMAVYSRQMSADNSREISRLRHNLIRALQEDVTEKQRKALLLYYAEGYNMREIGERMGVDKSTVSRTIKRGGGGGSNGACAMARPICWTSFGRRPEKRSLPGAGDSLALRFLDRFRPARDPAPGWRRQLTGFKKAFIIDATTKFDQKGTELP